MKPGPKPTNRDEIFWSMVDKTNYCWLWTGYRNMLRNGYGYFHISGRQPYEVKQLAHRYAYEYYNGPISPGMVIDHVCGITHCVNPDHLEEVTPKENQFRRRRKYTMARVSDRVSINDDEVTIVLDSLTAQMVAGCLQESDNGEMFALGDEIFDAVDRM